MLKTAEFFKARDYRFILLQEFETRRDRRPKYSLNAFARDIGLTSSRFTAVMKRRHGISATIAASIADALKFVADQRAFFVDLVESEHGRTVGDRERAIARLARYRPIQENIADEAELHLVAKWFYPATLELIKVRGGNLTIKEISSALRISQSEAQEAIETLLQLNEIKLLESGYEYRPRFKTVTSQTPSHIIRESHKNMLELTKHAIDRDHFSKRKARSTFLTFNSSRTEEARLWLEKMHKEFIDKFGASNDANSVIGLGLYMHRVDKDPQHDN